ncbi:MAG: hypothetical protein KJ578_11400 [Bacteroidetes bacterium]|nr:hypothetical protein [Bacteroidota bacterium]MBU2558374.1 hypothetical protein [Bacteroidota bacterium]
MNNPLKYTDPSGYHVLPNKHDYNAWLLPPPKGGGGFSGPGSGNHWSDPYRTENGNWMLGNHASFDGIYGEGAFDSYYNQHYAQQTKQNTTTGNVAEKDYGTILAWMQEGFNLTIINNTVIGYFGKLGEVRHYPDGAIKVYNPTAGAVQGEAMIFSGNVEAGKWGISLDFLISFGLPKMRNGFSLAFIKAKNDFGFSFTLYGNGDGYEIAASVNYLNIYSTNGKNLSIQETFGPGQTWSYGLHIGNYSRSGNGNINAQTASSYAIDAYGLSFGAPIASSHYQTYTWGITWSQIINYLYK